MLSKIQMLDILAEANEYQPQFRQLPYKSLVSAAYRAEVKAMSTAQVEKMVTDFANFASSSACKTSNSFLKECTDLLPAGHPMTDSPLEDRIAWVQADPDLSGKQTLVSSAISSDGIENVHAWARLRTLANSGNISSDLVDTITKLEAEVHNG